MGFGDKEHEGIRIIIKGEDRTDEVRSWSKDNGKVAMTYLSGKTYTYSLSNVRFIQTVVHDRSANNRFEYLKRLADVVGLQDSRVGNILANHYNKIRSVDNATVLSVFLAGKRNIAKRANTMPCIYPFGFNLSQKKAIDNALENQVSVIEGPPGTGKTQTILNIIANAVMRGKTIAVVSNNNSATSNVYEKLGKNKVDFISAYLGNTENKIKFVETQKPLPDIDGWNLTIRQKDKMEQSLQKQYSTLSVMLDKKNVLSQIQQELDALELEHKHFGNYYIHGDDLPALCLKPSMDSDTVLLLWISCERYATRGKMPGFFGRMYNRIFLGVRNDSFYSDGFEKMIAICQKSWYTVRIAELTKKISHIKPELERFGFDNKMEKYTSFSGKLFRDYLAKKYKSGKRTHFTLDDLRKNYRAFMSEYPVILSTTYSLRNSLSSETVYDYVVIDESSQVDLVTGALALSCAKNAVIVGDLKQLPNVVNLETSRKTDAVFAEFELSEAYRYKNHSLLLSIVELFPDVPRTLLREHYRCHPKIIDFCNQKFYNNQLIILTKAKSNREPLIVYKSVHGNHARGKINHRQIDMIKNEIIPEQNLTGNDISVGIVTPYRAQTNELQAAFHGTGIQADTVDKFQGRENDVIILSTVDNEISYFTDNANRLNVAVSRAIDQLIVVVNGGDNMRDKNIGDLVRYVEYNNLSIVQSKVRSVFDYLYKRYYKKRDMILRKRKRISEYDSENLMYVLICNVLTLERFAGFDVAAHIPLRTIIKDTASLDANETIYLNNIMTHVDFLIFDRIGKMPRLAIEVDGTFFHADGTRQAHRDKLKNQIFEKCGLPYRRFRTDGSGESGKLVNALEEVIGLDSD